jgi:hypothetical protein
MLGYRPEDFDENSASMGSESSSDSDSKSGSDNEDNDDDDKSDSESNKEDSFLKGGSRSLELGVGSSIMESPSQSMKKKKANVLDIDAELLDLLDAVAIDEGSDSGKVIESGADFMQKFKRLMDSKNVSSCMKARRVIDVLSDVLSRSYLLSRHLALIIDCFRPYGERKSTEYFGTYNVELIIAFFDKIIDMHNFDFVLCRLTAFEVGCLYCRLGILSIYNPAKPEGGWELNMSRWDERLVAKTLVIYVFSLVQCVPNCILIPFNMYVVLLGYGGTRRELDRRGISAFQTDGPYARLGAGAALADR